MQFGDHDWYHHDDDDDEGIVSELACGPCRDPRTRAFEPEGVEVLADQNEVEDWLDFCQFLEIEYEEPF